MNSPAPPESPTFSRANCIRRGALFGLALGMLAGLIWIGLAPPEGPEVVSIVRWRNTIIAGCGIGILTGIFWPRPKETTEDERD
jgi:Na+/proline symporter